MLPGGAGAGSDIDDLEDKKVEEVEEVDASNVIVINAKVNVKILDEINEGNVVVVVLIFYHHMVETW